MSVRSGTLYSIRLNQIGKFINMQLSIPVVKATRLSKPEIFLCEITSRKERMSTKIFVRGLFVALKYKNRVLGD